MTVKTKQRVTPLTVLHDVVWHIGRKRVPTTPMKMHEANERLNSPRELVEYLGLLNNASEHLSVDQKKEVIMPVHDYCQRENLCEDSIKDMIEFRCNADLTNYLDETFLNDFTRSIFDITTRADLSLEVKYRTKEALVDIFIFDEVQNRKVDKDNIFLKWQLIEKYKTPQQKSEVYGFYQNKFASPQP